jgi:hypothetical protein
MKRYSIVISLITILTFLNANVIIAQSDNVAEESPVSISVDLMSRYVWRGTDFGGSPSIQPGIEYSKSGFSIGVWGAYATNFPGVQEADLYLSYAINDMFSLTLTDYFFPDELSDYKYFDFGKNTTGHILEASISFNGTENLPLSVILATNVWGADAKRIQSDGTTGDIQYSTYAEVAYSFKYFDLFMGANFTSPDLDIGESGFYGDKAGIVNLGISTVKEISLSNQFKLPLTVSLITNPQAEKIYLVAGFSF